MIDPALIFAGCFGIAALAASIAATLAPEQRPWWHALPRQQPAAPAPSAEQVPAPATDTGPTQTESVERSKPTLHLVQTEDRRKQLLPFVGKDRREVGHAAAEGDERRQANKP